MILEYKDTPIFYTTTGKGQTIVLLHGFLEDHSMWKNILPSLSKTNQVVTIDLLGHGKSGCLGYIHTMEDQAKMVNAVLNKLGLNQFIFIGHSMGGYVALAFSKLFPESINGICLMNSTYQADDKERKLLRTRANKMVQNNFENMVRMSFSNLFSAFSKLHYKTEYEEALQIALKTSLQGYMAAQEGMKIREDFSNLFKNAKYNKAIILGKKDTVLDFTTISEFAKQHNIKTSVFNEGHMSHIENKKKLETAILHFVENK